MRKLFFMATLSMVAALGFSQVQPVVHPESTSTQEQGNIVSQSKSWGDDIAAHKMEVSAAAFAIPVMTGTLTYTATGNMGRALTYGSVVGLVEFGLYVIGKNAHTLSSRN